MISNALGDQIQEWLQLVQPTLNEDKKTFEMLTLLIKKYTKKQLDYEDLSNAIEELISQEKNRHLFICFPKCCMEYELYNSNSKSNALPTLEIDSTSVLDVDQLPILLGKRKRVDLQCQTFYNIDLETISKHCHLRTPPYESDTDFKSFDSSMLELSFDTVQDATTHSDVDIESIEETKKETFVEGTASTGTSEKQHTKLCQNTNILAHLDYIVHSLSRHHESKAILYQKDKPIKSFWNILNKCKANKYQVLKDLDMDVERLLDKLKNSGSSVERVRKHYEYLVGYYFPSQRVQGRLRSGR